MWQTFLLGTTGLCSAENMATFDVMAWNETHRDSWSSVNYDPPVRVAHWTRTSDTAGGQYLYGDASGKCSACKDVRMPLF